MKTGILKKRKLLFNYFFGGMIMDLSMLIYYKETRGYSLEEIADLSGVPLETVRKIFRGETDTLKTAAMEAVENVSCSRHR